jgi:hypothetical protein
MYQHKKDLCPKCEIQMKAASSAHCRTCAYDLKAELGNIPQDKPDQLAQANQKYMMMMRVTK